MGYIGVKAKIRTELMSKNALIRLNQILYRDSRIIRDYLNIIKENENSLFNTKKNGDFVEKIVDVKLDLITATTDTRPQVKHDLKSKYRRISLNELKECRDTATAMYNSYLSLKKNGSNYPTVNRLVPRSIGYRRFKIEEDNMVLSIMDSMDTNPEMIRTGKSRIRHDYLDIPVELNNYHLDNFSKGELKAVKILYQNNQLYVAFSIKKEVEQLKKKEKLDGKPIGVLGIDLGINIAASTALVTAKGVSLHKNFRVSKEIDKSYHELEDRISDLLRIKEVRIVNNLIKNLDTRIVKLHYVKSYNTSNHIVELRKLLDLLKNISSNNINQLLKLNKKLIKDFQAIKGQLNIRLDAIKKIKNKNKSLKNLQKQLYDDRKKIYNVFSSLNLIARLENQFDKKVDGIFRKLKELRNNRRNLNIEIDRLLILQIIGYIEELSQKYNIYVSLGKLKGIRNIARRGNGNKAHRKRMHRWSFSRITLMLENKLAGIGLAKRFLAVPEQWTSIKCYKCNTKGTRPKQSYFICSNADCGWKGNADYNGAVNIAKRLIKKFKLTKTSMFGKKGLGEYLPVDSPSKGSNGKAGHTPKARKRSPRSGSNSGTTGIKSLSEWFSDDLSEGLETPLESVGHTNRTSVQHSKLLDESSLTNEGSLGKAATSG